MVEIYLNDTQFDASVTWLRLRHGRNLSPDLCSAFGVYDVVKSQIKMRNDVMDASTFVAQMAGISATGMGGVPIKLTRDWKLQVDVHSLSKPGQATCDLQFTHLRFGKDQFLRDRLKLTFAGRAVVLEESEDHRPSFNHVWDNRIVRSQMFGRADAIFPQVTDWIDASAARPSIRY